MILSKSVFVKSSKYYNKIGYNIYNKYIEIDIKDLPTGSHVNILAKCDYCENIKEISYKDYNKNISINNKFSCSIKCGILKSKETNIIKYGVESVNELKSKKEKTKKTIIEKYGVDHISKLEYIKKSKSDKMKNIDISNRVKNYWNNLNADDKDKINLKRKNTCLVKYGVDHISKLERIKEKTKKTYKNLYGGYTYQSDELMTKVLLTNLKKYGLTYSSSSDIIKDKIKKTNLIKYGFEYASMNEEIKKKSINKLINRYGVGNIMLSEEFRKKIDISNEPGYVEYLGNRDYKFKCLECNTLFIIDYDNYYKRKLRNVNKCTNCFPIMENSSIKEKELRNYISSIYDNDVISNYRDGLEIDIYVPKLKIGFEFNGLYWHSKLSKNYHLNKTNYFKNKDIKIYHIWEDDWDKKRDILKSQIKNWLCLTETKIFARKCEIKEINDTKTYREFLDNNHIQGYIRSSIKIGLFYGNELISLMTFDNLEGRKKMNENEWNLSRFCNKLNINVPGGASKLLNYFIKTYKPNRIISYADMDWSSGVLYNKLGFNLINQLKPEYKYIIENKRVNKQRFTKKKLINNNQDPLLSESEIMNKLNICKIFNCGQLKFEMNINKY